MSGAVSGIEARLHLRKEYALLVAHVGGEQIPEPRQARCRIECRRSACKHSQFGMIGKDAGDRFLIERSLHRCYQLFLPVEMSSQECAPVLLHS